ncbi:MAG: flavin reductase family protein [candidate division WOR-3 bacterium]|nr:flavin reductase family protein [candidate division WOR-3 bacterium]
MKKEVPVSKANRLINSGNVIMVTSHYKDKSNIITIAWQTPVSIKPPALAIAVGKERFSLELIKKSGEFIVNIPNWDLLEPMLFCGTHSGRDIDKFKETKLTPEKAEKLIKTPRIKECIGSIECSVIDSIEVGDHIIFFGEILYAEAEEDLFKDGVWDTARAELIYHCGGTCFMKSSEYTKI